MKLTYNGLAFHTLASYIRCVGESAQFDPPEAPKRARRTLRFEVDFHEQTFADNRGLLDQIRSALNTQKGILTWLDDNGTSYHSHDVDILEHNLPAEANSRGRYWQQLTFTAAWWDSSITSNSFTASYQRTGAAAALDLGDIDDFEDAYNSELMNRMRGQRAFVGGRVTIRGRLKADSTMTLANRREELEAKVAALELAFKQGKDGRLRYGATMFDETVRVIDFLPQLAPNADFISYSLTCNYTRYPQEADYAIANYRASKTLSHEEGTENLALNGRIAAPTEALARAKLARLRTSVTAGGTYVLAQEEGTPEFIVSDQNTEGSTVAGDGDGEAFVELQFNDVYRKHSGGVVTWMLKVNVSDAPAGGYVRTIYSGTILAFGANVAAAVAIAQAKAATLGAGKLPFLLSSSSGQTERQYVTNGKVFVPWEFSFEYLGRSSRMFFEVRGEVANDVFGENVETVSGFIQAPTLSAAMLAYEGYVRDVASYSGALLLNERTPSQHSQRIIDGSDQSLDDRFEFSFTVHRAKTNVSYAYKLESQTNITELTVMDNLQGQIRAPSTATAEAALDALITSLGLTNKVSGTRGPSRRKGRNVADSADVDVLVSYDFNETFERELTGISGVLQCGCRRRTKYSGPRKVERPIVDGVSIIQQTGTSAARRSVNGFVRAATPQGCEAYARKIQTLLVNSDYQDGGPEIEEVFVFPSRTDGTPAGAGVNAKYYEWTFTFDELIPELAF